MDKAEFSNGDAAGSASGRFTPDESGPGRIDLQARLTRADGTAVWRYMPLVVNEQTRHWLRDSIVSGRAADARLRLQGNLAEFPFRDGKGGQFLVTAKISAARLEYAPAGRRSTTSTANCVSRGGHAHHRRARAHRRGPARSRDGLIARSRCRRDPYDKGQRGGPSNGFLAFVNQSPVGERIEHFTEGMTADGAGSLDLTLVMPLQHVADTTVKGEYRFAANTVRVAPSAPALTEASARIGFTAQRLEIADGAARLYGEPMRLSGGTLADGSVAIKASGNIATAALAKGLPAADPAHLSGRTAWRTDVSVRGGRSSVVLRSDLQGIASSLPAPSTRAQPRNGPAALPRPSEGARSRPWG